MNFILPGCGCQPGDGAKIKALRPLPVSMVWRSMQFVSEPGCFALDSGLFVAIEGVIGMEGDPDYCLMLMVYGSVRPPRSSCRLLPPHAEGV